MKQVIKTFQIDEQMARQLELEGSKIGLGFSAYVRNILYNHINNTKKQNTMK